MAALLCLVVAFIGKEYLAKTRDTPLNTKSQWSIGIYSGKSPFDLAPAEHSRNPVLSAGDVTDSPAEFVADPFMVKVGSSWYMFFEVMNSYSQQGDIAVALSHDGYAFEYKQIVLDEPFHLSYPYVFKRGKNYYMIPESLEAQSVRLYKATEFPTKWSLVKILLRGDYTDPSIFQYDGKWWLFVGSNPSHNDTLRLFLADDLLGPWTEHPQSPVAEADPNIARPAGRVISFEGKLFRFAQDDHPNYGNQVRVFKITKLTTATYQEEQLAVEPIITAQGSGWNAAGMHHIDVHQLNENKWIACVDGHKQVQTLGLTIDVPARPD